MCLRSSLFKICLVAELKRMWLKLVEWYMLVMNITPQILSLTSSCAICCYGVSDTDRRGISVIPQLGHRKCLAGRFFVWQVVFLFDSAVLGSCLQAQQSCCNRVMNSLSLELMFGECDGGQTCVLFMYGIVFALCLSIIISKKGSWDSSWMAKSCYSHSAWGSESNRNPRAVQKRLLQLLAFGCSRQRGCGIFTKWANAWNMLPHLAWKYTCRFAMIHIWTLQIRSDASHVESHITDTDEPSTLTSQIVIRCDFTIRLRALGVYFGRCPRRFATRAFDLLRRVGLKCMIRM